MKILLLAACISFVSFLHMVVIGIDMNFSQLVF